MNRTVILAAFAAAVTLAGCERLSDPTGRPVSFTVSSSSATRSPLAPTRTVYGDALSGTLSWCAGDLISVYCSECEGDVKLSEYAVSEPLSGDEAAISNLSDTVRGLRWGSEETHTFYGVYPGVTTSGAPLTTIEGTVVTGSTPDVQYSTGTTDDGSGNLTLAPDMRNMYMVCRTEADPTSGNDVTLSFFPLSTAVTFTVTNGFEDTKSAMTVSSVRLVSDSKPLNGGFKADWSGEVIDGRPHTEPAYGTTVEDAFRSVELDLSGSPVTLSYGRTLTFTLLLSPGVEAGDLTFEISGTNTHDASAFTRKARLEKADGTGITFPRHEKTVIKGLLVPESVAWTVDGAVSVVPWVNSDAAVIPIEE